MLYIHIYIYIYIYIYMYIDREIQARTPTVGATQAGVSDEWGVGPLCLQRLRFDTACFS